MKKPILEVLSVAAVMATGVWLLVSATLNPSSSWMTFAVFAAFCGWDAYRYWKTRSGKYAWMCVWSVVLAVCAIPLFPPSVWQVTRRVVGGLFLFTTILYAGVRVNEYREQRTKDARRRASRKIRNLRWNRRVRLADRDAHGG